MIIIKAKLQAAFVSLFYECTCLLVFRTLYGSMLDRRRRDPAPRSLTLLEKIAVLSAIVLAYAIAIGLIMMVVRWFSDPS